MNARDLVETLAELGAGYDASGAFPSESLARLREAGLHRRFAPLAAGGERYPDARARYAAMDAALRCVGSGDLSVGRLYEGHVNALLLFDWYGSAEQVGWLAGRLDAGEWFGVWATEPTPGVRIASGVLAGAKSFASGAGGIDHAVVTAAVEGADRRLVVVPAAEAARTDASGWRVRGMRASVSGRYALDGIEASADRLLGAPGDYDREPRFTAGAWRFCAVQLGGVEALVRDLHANLGADARDDPVRRVRFADAVAATRTAGFWVAGAARAAAEARADAATIADLTRAVVERSALDVMETAARLLGTRSAFAGERADKIIRDLSLYLRQGGPDLARDRAARALLEADPWSGDPP